MEKLYENLANHLRQKVVEQSNLQNELLACSYVLVLVNLATAFTYLLLHIYLHMGYVFTPKCNILQICIIYETKLQQASRSLALHRTVSIGFKVKV